MGFIKWLIGVVIIVGIVGLVAYDPTREAIKNWVIYTAVPVGISGYNSIVGSAWWQQYQLAIVVPPVFLFGIFLTAMYYKGKIRMWQWGARKATETAWGTKQPAPSPTPTPLATLPPTEEKKEVTA